MIRRRALLTAVALLVASTALAHADEVGDIVRWLRGLGFVEVVTSRSLLGRVQIRATGPIGTRELVVNPRTGEILRDVWVDAEGKLVRGKSYTDHLDENDDDSHGGSDGGDGGSDGGGDDNSGPGGGDDDEDDDEGDDDDGSDDGGSGKGSSDD